MATHAERDPVRAEEEVHREERLTDEDRREEERKEMEIRDFVLATSSKPFTERVDRAMDRLQRENRVASLSLAGEMAMDRFELGDRARQEGAGDNVIVDGAREELVLEGREAADEARTKRWYTRVKIWGFLLGTPLSAAATIFAGMAVLQTRPDDPDYDDRKAAREQLKKWRDLPDQQFWQALQGYARDRKLSLETQKFMMDYVSAYFPGDYVRLKDGEVARLRDVLVATYYGAVAQSPNPPSSAIYGKLADGLDGVDVEGRSKRLPRPQCADVAMIAFGEIIKRTEAST